MIIFEVKGINAKAIPLQKENLIFVDEFKVIFEEK